jgi:1-acyl-sn-glycerol-3-phosphate acyltransferase
MQAAIFCLYSLPASLFAFGVWTFAALLLLPFDPRGSRQLRVSRFFAALIFRCNGVSMSVEGSEYLEGGPRVLACNHSSPLDVLVIGAALRIPYRVVVQERLFRNPLLWALIGAGRHVRVSNGETAGSIQGMRRALRLLQEGGTSIVIFPQGDFQGNGYLPFREGAAYFGITAKVPIVPVALCGVDRIYMPGMRFVGRGHIVVRCGKPLRPESPARQNASSVTKELQEEVARLQYANRLN